MILILWRFQNDVHIICVCMHLTKAIRQCPGNHHRQFFQSLLLVRISFGTVLYPYIIKLVVAIRISYGTVLYPYYYSKVSCGNNYHTDKMLRGLERFSLANFLSAMQVWTCANVYYCCRANDLLIWLVKVVIWKLWIPSYSGELMLENIL